MIMIGILTMGWGLWASFNLKKPFDIFGAACAPIGLVLALIGTLLICVPGFFSR
jgi:hypothetical protein|tara:strand:- start:660 stop:821 length:162 start_codon:yes stop_codon:yes gene_type:complete